MARSTAAAATAEGERSTRDRILDIALDLFTDKGYENTSLREIAEQLGFSKAAIYYHFASKDEILMALHLRMHDMSWPVERLGELVGAGPEAWTGFVDEMIRQILANRKILLLHMRNRSAFEQIHETGVGHAGRHEDLEDAYRRLLGDPSVPVTTRVRLGCAVGAVMGGLFLSGELTNTADPTELDTVIETVSAAVRDLITGLPGTSAAAKTPSKTPAKTPTEKRGRARR